MSREASQAHDVKINRDAALKLLRRSRISYLVKTFVVGIDIQVAARGYWPLQPVATSGTTRISPDTQSFGSILLEKTVVHSCAFLKAEHPL